MVKQLYSMEHAQPYILMNLKIRVGGEGGGLIEQQNSKGENISEHALLKIWKKMSMFVSKLSNFHNFLNNF